MLAAERKQKIKDYAIHLGFDLVHIGPAELPPKYPETFKNWIADGFHGEMDYLSRRVREKITIQKILPATQSIITLGTNYFQPDHRTINKDEGQISRYAVTRDYHKIIRHKLKNISTFLGAEFAADTRHYVDTGPVLERAHAETSGLGYIGKNSCIITESYGSWVFLAVILTTIELPPDHDSVKLRCGTCRRCIDLCPTGAILNNRTIDARKCISYLTIENRGEIPVELRDHIGNWLFGCDICQEVCPHNVRAVPARLTDFNEIRIKDRVILLQTILGIKSDKEFLDLFAGTPLMRAKRRGLIRNACVVAGNSGQTKFIPDLRSIAQSSDAMLAEHALWAITKLTSASADAANQ